MYTNIRTINLQDGYAAMLLVFIIGLVGTLIASSLLLTGYFESTGGRAMSGSDAAFYSAQSGVEEAVWRIRNDAAVPSPFTVSLPGGSAQITVSGSGDNRVVQAAGQAGNFVRRLEVALARTTIDGFEKGIHAGDGGLDIDGTSSVTASVYSNSYIHGKSNSCGTSGSVINGSVAAHDDIDTVCINGDATASAILASTINGVATTPTPPPPPLPFPITDQDITNFKDIMSASAEVFPGDCTIGAVGDCSRMVAGIPTIGNLIIEGTLLFKPSVHEIQVDGPIWIKGSSPVELKSATLIASDHTIFLADAGLLVTSNETFTTHNDKIMLFISTLPSLLCTADEAAIGLSAEITAEHVVFFSPDGCAFIKSGSSHFLISVMGYRIYVDTNTDIVYDPLLDTVEFNVTQSGWQVTEFKEF